jgi:hypothetical protein
MFPIGSSRRLLLFMQVRAPFILANADITPDRKCAGSFMEAYFSNFIEGTEFAVGEAVEITFEGRVPEARPQGGHDVLGAYLQLIDLGERSATSIDADAFIDEVQERHRNLMAQRPSVRPGVLKTKPNQAGNTAFVHPDLVRGTLREGVSILRSIADPPARDAAPLAAPATAPTAPPAAKPARPAPAATTPPAARPVPIAAPAPSWGPPETMPLAMPGPKMPRPRSDRAARTMAMASAMVGWLAPNVKVNWENSVEPMPTIS